MEILPSLLSTVANESPELIVVINPDHSLAYVSPGLASIAGMEAGKANGKRCYQLLWHREEPCEGTTFPCPLKQDSNPGGRYCLSRDCPEEVFDRRPLSVACYPLKDNGNEVVQAIGILRDTAEAYKKKSELNLLYRLAVIGNLVHGLAHNVNTPLSAVIARAEMLGDRLKVMREVIAGGGEIEGDALAAKLDKSIRDADVIVTNAMKISDIIRNMMNKRLQEEDDNPQMLSLKNLLEEELQFLEANMTFKHEIKKTYHLDDSLPLIKGVYSHFSQCFSYIMSNAMQSLGRSEKKELTVSTRYADDTIYLEVHDTGCDGEQGAQDCCVSLSDTTWLAHARELLKPYDAKLQITRKPHDNCYTITIPSATGGKGC